MNHPLHLIDLILFVGLLLAATVQVVGVAIIILAGWKRHEQLLRKGIILAMCATFSGTLFCFVLGVRIGLIEFHFRSPGRIALEEVLTPSIIHFYGQTKAIHSTT